jgi:hypothetical protein
MALLPKLSTQFVDSWVITFDSCLDLSAAAPEKCVNKISTMTVELQRMIGRWSLSGKGDEDLDGYGAGEEMNTFGRLVRCSQGALDSRANFMGTSQPYILYLWEYLNAHDLLKTSFSVWIQRLQPGMEARGFLPSFNHHWRDLHLPMRLQHWKQGQRKMKMQSVPALIC